MAQIVEDERTPLPSPSGENFPWFCERDLEDVANEWKSTGTRGGAALAPTTYEREDGYGENNENNVESTKRGHREQGSAGGVST